MKTELRKKLSPFACGLGLALGLSFVQPTFGDDTEIFTGGASVGSGVTPNVVFIIDTSGSMDGEVVIQPVYDPGEIYAGLCDPNRVFWAKEGDNPPKCDDDEWFDEPALVCDVARGQLSQNGISTLDFMAQWEPDDGVSYDKNKWDKIDKNNKTGFVECFADSGVHGEDAGDPEVYATDGLEDPWTTDPALVVEWGEHDTKEEYTLYMGNYLNWTTTAMTQISTRLEVVQDVTKNLLDNLTGVNVGLMRFSNNGGDNDAAAEGGMVIHAVEPVELGREALKTKIDGLDHSGWTPLAETMYEAALYFRGGAVDYGVASRGNTQQLEPSVAESRTGPGADGGDYYLSPVPVNSLSCQKNFIVLLTDGQPTRDNSADTKVAGLTPPSFLDTTGRAACDGSGAGRCLDDVAEYLYEADLNDDDTDGHQNVITHTIGFAIDLPILEETAERGGGNYYTADSAKSLEDALLNIVTDILDDNTTFVSPTVSVNAFNKVETLSDLFIAVFQADSKPLWNGNLKKYQLLNGEIVGKDSVTPVVDPNTGFFSATSESVWSPGVDGPDVKIGGAASLLGAPDSRNIYVNMGGDSNEDLVNNGNHLEEGNGAIDDAILGIGGGDPSREDLIAHARGQDVLDENDDGDITDVRKFIGDPLHAKPVSVVYGGTAASPDAADAVVYMATNEGYLHAIDGKTGAELWAFMPRQLLGNLKDWYENTPSSAKGYGLDGDIRTRFVDMNGNGIIEPGSGDRVVLYFGMRRGGSSYFALEVTDRNAPELLWAKDTSDYPGLAQTWSTPSISRVNIQGATQNSEKAVLIFAGGYNTTQDNAPYSTDGSGNGMYIADAETGDLLWRAGGDASADLQKTNMNNAIPAAVRVLDMNNDGFADRMYVGDMGGRLWRFDIFNGQPAADLVRGGVMASLGAGDIASPGVEDNRRFYNTPDVSLLRRESGSFLAVSLGSGYRAHPLDMQMQDSFYSIRDFNPFRQLSAAEYAVLEANMLTHDDARLANVSGIAGESAPSLPSGAWGWRMDLPSGEKVLAQSRTFQEKIFFTTYSPTTTSNANSCVPQRGTNRLYIVAVEDGKPAYNLDEIGTETALKIEDRSKILKQSGIAPDVAFIFQSDPDGLGGGGGGGGGCGTSAGARPRCLVGLESCPADFCNAPVRTFWTQDDATDDQ
ncbi:MAG: PQQ-binding-like beta-propeller repeat protein [Gammaproteobacteria bacterium]|nr:PQQ-binding-like beta-propeller repeat protein [Gammaproteobacteria bacterium]